LYGLTEEEIEIVEGATQPVTTRFHAQQREAERQAEHLFQALLHRAFRGEL